MAVHVKKIKQQDVLFGTLLLFIVAVHINKRKKYWYDLEKEKKKCLVKQNNEWEAPQKASD